MEKVSTLRAVNLRNSKYVFILSLESEQKDDLQRALNAAFEKFGDEGGLSVSAVRATSYGRAAFDRDLKDKLWPLPIRKRLKSESAPALVVLENYFDEFDPQTHNWRIIWFGDARRPRDYIPQLFRNLLSKLKSSSDVFDYLDSQISLDTGMANFGGVSSPKRAGVATRQRRDGRPGILDPEYALRETVGSLVKNGFVSDLRRGWKKNLADKARDTNPALSDFTTESVYKAMAKAGVFVEVEQRINPSRSNGAKYR